MPSLPFPLDNYAALVSAVVFVFSLLGLIIAFLIKGKQGHSDVEPVAPTMTTPMNNVPMMPQNAQVGMDVSTMGINNPMQPMQPEMTPQADNLVQNLEATGGFQNPGMMSNPMQFDQGMQMATPPVMTQEMPPFVQPQQTPPMENNFMSNPIPPVDNFAMNTAPNLASEPMNFAPASNTPVVDNGLPNMSAPVVGFQPQAPVEPVVVPEVQPVAVAPSPVDQQPVAPTTLDLGPAVPNDIDNVPLNQLAQTNTTPENPVVAQATVTENVVGQPPVQAPPMSMNAGLPPIPNFETPAPPPMAAQPVQPMNPGVAQPQNQEFGLPPIQ